MSCRPAEQSLVPVKHSQTALPRSSRSGEGNLAGPAASAFRSGEAVVGGRTAGEPAPTRHRGAAAVVYR